MVNTAHRAPRAAKAPEGARDSASAGRNTRQRRALLAALAEHPDFTSAQDLHQRLCDKGETIGLTTVYRTLHALTEAGLVDSVRDEAGRRQFRARPTVEHQHYLRCRSCGFNVPVASRALERWAKTTAADLGFAQVEHVVELTGLCAQCQAQSAADR